MKTILTITILVLACPGLFSQGVRSCCAMSSSRPTEAFAQLGSDESFRMSHAEPLPFVLATEKGTWVKFTTPDKKEGRAYEVSPKKKTNAVIFVIHEWWGLNDYVRQEAENLQKELEEVTVLALDLYDEKVATTREEAAKYMGEVKEDRARAIIKGALDYVGPKAHVGTIGWCFGGGWSLQASLIAEKQGKACVIYYGMPESDVNRLKSLEAPVLGIFAKQDGWITPKVVEEFERNMKAAQKELTVRWYDGDHAFANPSNPKYDQKATEDAWSHVTDFFKTQLK
ncbi:MAG: dienelactone hydrolase family protein [Ignavibacteriales bacterium]|nr:dienelactone hydrolase family protein [Ignavibacteriales bacterium]